MSQETMEWLNVYTLIGFTEQRGNAWHYREALQNGEPNHYVGAIPVEDVRRRLFNWEAIELPVFVQLPDGTRVQLEDRKAVARGDNFDVLGLFKDGYRGHQYQTWLVRNVETILDDSLQVGSAGLLKNGAQAWVSVEVPENITTPSGVVFRPQLIAATSFDGSLATTYKRSSTIVVCDNTLAAGLTGDGERFKVKHTTNSLSRIADAKAALGIVYSTADEVSQEIERLLSIDVTPQMFTKVVDIMVPLPKDGKDKSRSLTMATNKRDELLRLYNHDDRVTPFAGTGFGVLQAFNTYRHHSGIVRGTSRALRNAGNALGNAGEENDREVVAALDAVRAGTLTFAMS